MIVRRIRRNPIFLRECGVRALSEAVTRIRIAILPYIETYRKLVLKPLEFLPWTDAIGAIAKRQHLRAAGRQPVTRLRDVAVASIQLMHPRTAPYTKHREQGRERH